MTTLTKPGPVKLAPQKYDHLIGMEGFSEKLLKNHFKLYEGYVSNTNAALEELNSLADRDEDRSPHYAEIKRRLGWEFNGARLHEYYFDNLGGAKGRGLEDCEPAANLIKTNFGDIERWKKDFISTGAMRGIGWAALYYDPPSSRLFNMWIEEHNVNHIAGGRLLLIMDVFEHAFTIDYGTDRAKYIEAFFKNINWETVTQRCEALPMA